jgi:DNA-binding NarL/FixJ family response regulator
MALELRAAEPELGVLVLSQYVEPTYTAELLAQQDGGGVGYLLKERVGEVSAFLDAVRAVAGGGTAIDREVMATLLGARTSREPSPIDALSPREREVLALMAEGRTNAGIARDLVVTIGAVEKHVGSIFSKLDLPSGDDDHRRVLAVLAYLRSA